MLWYLLGKVILRSSIRFVFVFVIFGLSVLYDECLIFFLFLIGAWSLDDLSWFAWGRIWV